LTIFVGLIWAQNAEASMGAQTQRTVLILCGLGVIIATRIAIDYRRRNPLVSVRSSGIDAGSARQSDQSALDHLTGQISIMLKDETFVSFEGLKVADLAARVNAPVYKVTQCITGTLGFANFNQMINARRIDMAKERLADEAWSDKSISTIAFACGFASLGTFNRAFKGLTGSTPRDYRASIGCSRP
ncbi:MAG: helix-turn-helix domain-containing protein, partial [Pseudomonadota bacterium]